VPLDLAMFIVLETLRLAVRPYQYLTVLPPTNTSAYCVVLFSEAPCGAFETLLHWHFNDDEMIISTALIHGRKRRKLPDVHVVVWLSDPQFQKILIETIQGLINDCSTMRCFDTSHTWTIDNAVKVRL